MSDHLVLLCGCQSCSPTASDMGVAMHWVEGDCAAWLRVMRGAFDRAAFMFVEGGAA